jgi:hypothetical protein
MVRARVALNMVLTRPWLYECAFVVCLTRCALGVPQPLTITHVEHRGHPMVDLGVVTASVVREDDCCC